jgi:hypothetical protein
MTEALGAAKGERTPARLGYRSGYYDRTLVSRVGKLEPSVPQDRDDGRFSTELFERYQQVRACCTSSNIPTKEWQLAHDPLGKGRRKAAKSAASS